MPRRAWQFRIRDMLDAIERIQRYVRGMDGRSFAADDKTVDAVVRNLIVIGEAAGHLPDEIVDAYPDVPWRLVRGMRNVVVHEYWGVSRAIVWQTIVDDLPALTDRLKRIIDIED